MVTTPLSRYLSLFRRWAWLLVLGTVLASLASYLVSRSLPPVYRVATPTPVATTPPTSAGAALAGCLDGSFGTSMGPVDAYELPVSRRDELQSALDTHKVVRLQKGNYRGSLGELRLSSNQRLFGVPGGGLTLVPRITVNGGTSGAVLSGIHAETLTFPSSGAVTRANCFTKIVVHQMSVSGGSLEDNLFLHIQGNIDVDTRAGGSLRNNRFIRVRAGQSPTQPLRVRGDGGRASGGNVWLWYNALTPHGESLYFENQADATLVGMDAEAWNQYGLSSSPLLKTGPMGTLRVLHPNGGQNTDAAYQSGTYDIAADEFQLYDASARSGKNPDLILRAQNKRTAMLAYQPQSTADEASGALRLRAFENAFWPSGLVADAFVDGRSVTQGAPAAAQQEALRRMFVAPGRPGVPWERPAFGPIPDPAGPGWSADLAGKPDATDYLQGLIDSQGIARVPAGLYHISRPLRLKAGQGLLGAGDTRTAIIAKSPALDMLVGDVHCDGESVCPTKFALHGITLQGGRNGIHWDVNGSGIGAQYSDSYWSHVTFRDMAEAGIFVDGIMGWDNNTLDHVNFYRNGTGVKQRSSWSGGGEPGQSYIDKVVFFHNQFVENGRALDLDASRQNTMNAWINTLFKDNTEYVAYMRNSIGTLFANSDFINNGGDPMINMNYHPAFVSAYFRADARGVTMLTEDSTCEGCVFERGSSTRATIMAGLDVGEPNLGFFYNNRSTDMPLGPLASGLFLNNTLAGDPQLTGQGKLLKDGKSYTIIEGAARPQPQLLAGSRFR